MEYKNDDLIIRGELEKDANEIFVVHQDAFKRDDEALLTNNLRKSCEGYLGFVAELDGKIVGHILYTPVIIGNQQGLGLAPLSILSAKQKSGIGSKLITTSLQILKEKNIPWVVVLGHSKYYPKFGFQRSDLFDIKCEFPVAPEAFMILELQKNSLKNTSGTAQYHSLFHYKKPTE